MQNKETIRHFYEEVASSYNVNAVLQTEIAKRLGERLDYIKHQPKLVLDAGSGTGVITKDLLKRYPKSQIIALDIAFTMALKTQKQGGWLRKPKAVCGDADMIPFKNQSFDLIVSNLMIHLSSGLNKVFSNFHSVLAPNGLLLFSTFSTDTLKEARESWSMVDKSAYESEFIDMHEIGDALLKAGFINPVTDMELMTMTYSNVSQMMKDIKLIDMSNLHDKYSSENTHKDKIVAFEQAYDKFKTHEGLYPASFEIVYGHAWVGEGFKFDGFEKVIPIHPA